jgi:hypothetical protein
MKFVVPIPLWLYIIGFLVVASVAATIGVYVLAGILAIGLLYFLFTAPKQTIVVILLLVAIKYWQIALIAGAVILVISFVIGLFKPKETQTPSPEGAPSTDARPTAESTEAMSAQVTEQNRQRQNQIDADSPHN